MVGRLVNSVKKIKKKIKYTRQVENIKYILI